MRSILTELLCFVLTMTSIAQNNNEKTEHMTFKGVPIDGTLNEYVSKMKQSGFILIETEDGVAILQGDFAAYKDCIIGVATLKGKDLVSKITVIFPEQETWSSLSSNYYNLKELLTEKYGEPSEIIEKFDTYSEPDDDGDRMNAVKMDNCKYYTTFELENGSIQISIDHQSVISCFVRLSYFDKINSEKIRQKAIDDL
ncbi:hypothetical protein SAMN05192553_105108 [Cyclobacterium xiamenense]|uniref:Uncharacterized protein n=1 Tax=Cyclobacterium xiamenense TaxID=1297121 RepID=A0A1H6ZUN9_9BACT|nr:hypothetical protein [Cyclobacterium xiamenense]SEJ56366.1 hypothetical protein SAMN05192553_105108 [Cyclobacterium xiamenense]